MERATAVEKLREVSREFIGAKSDRAFDRTRMRDLIAEALVDQTASIADLAQAAGVKRNYVDRIKSTSGAAPLRGVVGVVLVSKVKYNPEAQALAIHRVEKAAKVYRDSCKRVIDTLKDRDKVICEVYRSHVMGPTEIGRLVDLDRNSVMRILRMAGVPSHREEAVSQ